MSTVLPVAAWPVAVLVASAVITFLVRRREPEIPSAHLAMCVLVVTGFAALAASSLGPVPEVMVPATFAATAVPLAAIDLRTGRLPNWLMLLSYTLTAGALLVAAVWAADLEPLVRSLGGLTSFLLFYAALYIFVPGQLGGGDVKLAGISGAVLGWQSWSTVVTGLLLIWLLGALMFVVTTAIQRARRRCGVAHGPAMVIGTVIAILAVP